jgi:hypothetical protein
MPCQPVDAENLVGARRGFRRAPLVSRQPAYKPGSGWHAGRARIRDGHSSGTPVTRRLQQPTRTARSGHDPEALRACAQSPRAVPIRSCSRWGLPCRRRYRRRGALLPHRFTLTAVVYATRRGGLFSVALSLGSHPPDVIRHRLSTEPGLSSPAPPPTPPPQAGVEGWGPERPSGRLTGQGMGSLPAAVKSPSFRRRPRGDRS